MAGQTNISTGRVSEYKCIRVKAKLWVNLLNNFLIQDKVYGHTYIIGLDYRVALLIILY